MVVEEEYLFNDIAFEDAEWEEIEGIVLEAEKKPRYVPSREEMLAFGDAGYWPEIPESKAVEGFLEELLGGKLTPRDIEEVVLELHFLFQQKNLKLNDMTKITNPATGRMNRQQVQKLMHLVMAWQIILVHG